MSNVWEEFDSKYDTEMLQQDADEAAANGSGDYKEVGDGNYEVEIEKFHLTTSKSNKPMVTLWFNILAGDNKGQKIFYNQVIDQGFGLHLSKEFLGSLGTSQYIEFKSFSQYATLIANVKDETDEMEFALSYGHNKKGFPTFEITDIYDKE